MPKPVCVPCQRFFRPDKNAVAVIEAAPRVSEAEPGTSQPGNWKPYKLWMADRWKCQGCGATIVVGFGHAPLSEHYKPDFAAWVDSYTKEQGPLLRVNDC